MSKLYIIILVNQIGYATIMQDTTVTANTRGLVMKAVVVSDSKVRIHTEDGFYSDGAKKEIKI